MYEGIDTPRIRSVLGGYLPSARVISNVMHKSDCCPAFSDRLAVAVMQFGQFIEHDVISTPMITGMLKCHNTYNLSIIIVG